MRHIDVVTTYTMGHYILKWENVMMTLLVKPFLQNFLVIRGRKCYKRFTWNFDMTLDLDKYTSWFDFCIDAILDSNTYMSTSWIESLYKYCGPEVLMTICTIANEVWMNVLHAHTFIGLLLINCWWLFLPPNSCTLFNKPCCNFQFEVIFKFHVYQSVKNPFQPIFCNHCINWT